VKLAHLVGFITKKFVTMHGHMSRCTVTCYDARSHERKKKFVLLLTVISIECCVCVCLSVCLFCCLSCSTCDTHAPYNIVIYDLSGSTIF